jgi:hypothetical protein
MEVNVRPRPGIFLQFSNEYNDVRLPEGSFVTRLYRLDARTQFNPWISLANNVQYDSESRIVGWQMRSRRSTARDERPRSAGRNENCSDVALLSGPY